MKILRGFLDQSRHTYKCKYCGFECRTQKSPAGLSATKIGHYGDNCTPPYEAYAEEYLEASTISFTSTPSIADSASQFKDCGLRTGYTIRISTTSGTNDGDYIIQPLGLAAGEILTDGSLTTESAATAGTVTISRLVYKPVVAKGCGFCGSLNSK